MMRTIELKIPAESGFEKVAMQLAANCAEMMGMTESRIADVRTAVAEACINAMEHGNASDVTTKIYVAMTIETDRLAIDVADEGRAGPPPGAVGEPDVGAQIDGLEAPGGMGLFVIKALVDEADWVPPDPGYGNQFRMVIHVQPMEDAE